MEKHVLKIRAYPQMVQDFARANFDLKLLTAASLGVACLALALVIFLVRRGPIVIALSSSGEIAKIEEKVTDLQIAAAAREYIRHRYSWDDSTVSREIKRAEFFVDPALVKSFEHSLSDTIKFVVEKKVKQRVYERSVDVDLAAKKIVVSADRFTEFDGLKAATDMTLQLWFTIGERTVTNPWGVYITKELEGGAK